MESRDIGLDVIEKITKATVLAFEQLKEVEKDSKAKSKRIRSLEYNLETLQNNVSGLTTKLEDTEDLNVELLEQNAKLKDVLMDLEIELTRTEGVLEDKLKVEKHTVETLKAECIELKAANKLKDELCNKQKEEIDVLSVENAKYKKITKKYAKTVNAVSPQAVNNIRFVKKFPALESKCNSLIEKLEQTERERDNLLSKIIAGSKRPAPTANFSNMDRNAQLMQQFSPAARAAARQQQQPSLQQFIPRQQQFYVNNNTSPSSPSPTDAKKQKI